MNAAARDSGIRADRKSGMTWDQIDAKYKCGKATISKALHAGGLMKKKKAKKVRRVTANKPETELSKINKALQSAIEKRLNPVKVAWYVATGSGKLPVLTPHKSKDSATRACLEAKMAGKPVKLLREVPFKLTIVIDE